MSKVGQEVLEAEEFACENYNISRDDFITLANKQFSKPYRPLALRASIDHFDVIQKDLHNYFEYVGEQS